MTGGSKIRSRRLASVWLADGVSRRHALVALLASLLTIGLLVFINVLQPYLLTQMLKLPVSEIGAISGRLAGLHEIVAILVMSLAGALSDRWGRRLLYACGFALMGCGYLLYPLAHDVAQLAIFRLVFAVGASTALVMFTTIAVDYSRSEFRGRALGLANLVSGIGVLIFTAGMAQMPAALLKAGHDAQFAGRTTFWLCGAICLAVAILLASGLKKGRLSDAAKRPALLASLRAALGAGSRSAPLALTYGAAFVGRGDMAIIGLFLPLWVTRAGSQIDITPGQILIRSSLLLAAHQLAVILSAFLAGVAIDRFRKLPVLIVSFLLATAGYLLLWLLGDPLSNSILLGIIPLAMGEISIVVANNAMAGELSPVEQRGSVLGVLGVSGGVGVLVVTVLGGEAFDSIGLTAPFLMMAMLNVLIVIWGLLVFRRFRTT